MSVVTETVKSASAATERLGEALHQLEDNVRRGRHAIVRARHATEDGTAALALQVRRHPIGAVAVAAGVGALAGGLIGVVVARTVGRKSC